MRRLLLAPLTAAVISIAAPSGAQDAAGAPPPDGAAPGTQPMTGTSAVNYVAWAADSDLYEIQSSELALQKGKSDAVKSLAREMVSDHRQTTQTLLGALPKTGPRIPAPAKVLSQPNADKVGQLRQASGADFDRLYLQQKLAAHQQAWALHKGYATDGSDPVLRQVATAAVPIIEKHLQHLKTMPASGM